MGVVINLRLARKAKIRTESLTAAAANREKFGAAKSEKKLAASRSEAAARLLDGHKRDTPEKP